MNIFPIIVEEVSSFKYQQLISTELYKHLLQESSKKLVDYKNVYIHLQNL